MSKDTWVFKTVPEASRWAQETYDVKGDYLTELNKLLCRRPVAPVAFSVKGATLMVVRGINGCGVDITVTENVKK